MVPDAHPASCAAVTDSFSGKLSGWGVALTIPSGSNVGTAIPLLTVCACLAYNGTGFVYVFMPYPSVITSCSCDCHEKTRWTICVWPNTEAGTAVTQWLRCCATNRKVAGSIPDGVIGIFHWHNPYPTAFPYGNGMVLHFYQQQESSTTKTVHKVINKGLKMYV